MSKTKTKITKSTKRAALLVTRASDEPSRARERLIAAAAAAGPIASPAMAVLAEIAVPTLRGLNVLTGADLPDPRAEADVAIAADPAAADRLSLVAHVLADALAAQAKSDAAADDAAARAVAARRRR